MTVVVEPLDGAHAREVRGELESVCTEAFAAPPYFKTAEDITTTFKRFPSQTKRPGFALTVARDAGNRMVGLCYGYPLGPDTGWWRGMLEPVPAELTAEDGRRTFAVFELAVHPAWQRRGFARAMHDRLFQGRPEQRVILNCRPDAEAAQGFYRSLGYRRVTSVIPWQGAPVYDVLMLDLGSLARILTRSGRDGQPPHQP